MIRGIVPFDSAVIQPFPVKTLIGGFKGVRFRKRNLKGLKWLLAPESTSH